MKKFKRLLILLLLSILTIFALLKIGNIDVSAETLARVNGWWLAASFVTLYFTIVVRGSRWRRILKTIGWPVSFVYALTLLMAGLFVSAILPARLGDVGRVAMLKQDHQVPVSHSVASIATERALDIFSILTLTFVGMVWALHGRVPAEVWQLIIGTTALFGVGLTALLTVPRLEGWLRNPFPGWQKKMGVGTWPPQPLPPPDLPRHGGGDRQATNLSELTATLPPPNLPLQGGGDGQATTVSELTATLPPPSLPLQGGGDNASPPVGGVEGGRDRHKPDSSLLNLKGEARTSPPVGGIEGGRSVLPPDSGGSRGVLSSLWTLYQKLLDFGFSLIHGVRALGRQPVVLGIALAESLAIWLGDALLIYFAMLSIGLPSALGVSLFSGMVADLIAAVPITPGAIGQFDAALVGLLQLFDISLADSSLTVILVRLLSLWTLIPITGAITYIFGFSRALNLNRQAVTTETAGPAAAPTPVES